MRCQRHRVAIYLVPLATSLRCSCDDFSAMQTMRPTSTRSEGQSVLLRPLPLRRLVGRFRRAKGHQAMPVLRRSIGHDRPHTARLGSRLSARARVGQAIHVHRGLVLPGVQLPLGRAGLVDDRAAKTLHQGCARQAIREISADAGMDRCRNRTHRAWIAADCAEWLSNPRSRQAAHSLLIR